MHLQKNDLLGKVISAIRSANWQIEMINSPSDHPLRVRIFRENEHHELLIYIWNISHGGKTRSRDEFRIQITGVDSISLSTEYITLLLGYFSENEKECFVAFDPVKHSTFGFSPSIQVKKNTLDKAIVNGIAIQEKSRNEDGEIDEVAIAFEPELMIQYITDLSSNYYNQKIDQNEMQVFERLGEEEEVFSDEELEIDLGERKHSLKKTNQAVRDASFRKRVLKVYGNKCAICCLQVGLVEACHIIPVSAGGTDQTINGIALCHNHHKTLDSALIGIDENYEIILNESKLQTIRQAGLIGKLEDLLENSRIGEKIILPDNSRYYPNSDFLVKSLRINGFYSD